MPSRRRRRPKRSAARQKPPSRSFLQRRSTRWLFAAIITLAIGITLGRIGGGFSDGDGGGEAQPTPTLALALPELQPDGASLQRAEVERVIDGDTIAVTLAGQFETIRYYGIDTPERGDACFEESTERNAALAGDAVLLLPGARERDAFGRLLRYAFDEDGGSIEARLIAEGLGEAWRQDGAYRDELVALEEEVQTLAVGCLWGG